MNPGTVADGVNTVWILVAAFLVFFMQPGFLMLEAGQVRSKNVASVALKNLFDWAIGILVFFVAGLGIANVVGDLTSSGGLGLAASFSYVTTPGEWIGWFVSAVFAMTAATIVSGAVVGRIKFRSYAVYSVLVTMIIYPVVVGLVWNGGLLSESGYLGQLLGVGYLDFAGGTVVHMVGGVAGLVAAAILGPRADRYGENGESKALPGHSVLFAVLGTLFLAFGWFGFNVGTQATVLTENGAFMGEAIARVLIVTALGMAAGAVATSLVTIYFEGTLNPLATADGILAGLVAVTAGAAYITWWGGILIGGVGGALVYPAFQWTTERRKIDDVCGVFAIHGVSGAVGALLLPFVAVGSGGGWAFPGVSQLLMQVAGVLIIGLWTAGATTVILIALQRSMGLQVDSESEEPGLDKAEHNIIAYPQFATDGGVETATASGAGGPQPAESATMWRGEELETDDRAPVLTNAGLDSFPNPAYVVDTTNSITQLNGQALQFFELTEKGALDTTPESLAEASEDSLSVTARVLDTESEVRDEAGTVTIDGETVPVAVTATPLYEDGSLVGALTVIRNIADEVAAERHRQTVEEYRDSALATHQEKLSRLAAGDLELDAGVPAPSGEHADLAELESRFEELDDSLIETTENIRAVVKKAPKQSGELAENSTTLSATGNELEESITNVNRLADDIEQRVANLSEQTSESTAAVSDLSAAIEEVTASTTEIRSTATAATETTQECVGEMIETVEHIREASETTTEATEAIAELEENMQAVDDIITIIQDIAKKTNMLALNASIEAANAEDDGDGFAVVAEEVKALAEETESSANEIATIIETTQEQTDTVASAIEETSETITTGADIVEATAEDLKDVETRIEETNSGVAEIADAVDRQATNTQQVSNSMQEIEEDVDRINTLTTDIAGNVASQKDEVGRLTKLADSLSTIATDMHANIDTFDLSLSGETGGVSQPG